MCALRGIRRRWRAVPQILRCLTWWLFLPLVHRVCPDRREVEQENKLQPGDIAAHRIRVYAAKFEQLHAPLHRGPQPHEHEELILAAAANDIEVRQLLGIPSRTSYIRRSLTAVAGAAGLPCKDEFHLLSKLRSEHPKVMSFKKTNAKEALRAKWATAENCRIWFGGYVPYVFFSGWCAYRWRAYCNICSHTTLLTSTNP